MLRRLLAFLAVSLCLATTASAQALYLGPRLGVSIDPDQFVLGGQMVFGPLAEDLYFSPNLELGFGDDLTVVQLNGDLLYVFRPNNDLNPYVGGGIGFAFIEFDSEGLGDDSETEVGANLVGGLRFLTGGRSSHFFTELRLGLGDIPDLKLIGGWNFGM